MALAISVWLAFVQDPSGEDKHPWIRFKPGSWVEYRISQDPGTPQYRKETLLRTSKNEYVLQIESGTESGKFAEKEERTFPVRVDLLKADGMFQAAGDTTTRDKGTEDLTVDGKTFSCKVSETETRGANTTSIVTLWTCDDAPSKTVKMISQFKSPQMASKLTVSLEKLAEEISVGGHKGRSIKAYVIQTKSEGDQTKEATLWKSQEVPGGIAKGEETVRFGEFKMETRTEVVGFHIAP